MKRKGAHTSGGAGCDQQDSQEASEAGRRALHRSALSLHFPARGHQACVGRSRSAMGPEGRSGPVKGEGG